MGELSPKVVGCRLLENIQGLFQNGEIDHQTKTRIVGLVKIGMETGDFKELNVIFKSHLYATTMHDCVENCIQLTAK